MRDVSILLLHALMFANLPGVAWADDWAPVLESEKSAAFFVRTGSGQQVSNYTTAMGSFRLENLKRKPTPLYDRAVRNLTFRRNASAFCKALIIRPTWLRSLTRH